MSDQRAWLVVDLGFGDAGKGTLVDFLTRRQQAQTVIRFNGGAQAAHNVVTPDGRHHTFAQFGSGTFVPGVQTYLSRFMLVEPYALFNEEDHLRDLGVLDALARTALDRRALIITPFQQAANRLREQARGDNRHGSCGVGIGETKADWLKYGDDVLFAADLADRATVVKKLRRLRDAKWSELAEIAPLVDQSSADLGVFTDPDLIAIAAENYEYLTTQIRIVDETYWEKLLRQPGALIFEGAQGVLLDENYGFAPYTTWSTTTFANALTLLTDYAGEITRLGVLRTYFTRHGAGPFVTEDPALVIPEAHNRYSPWQQTFRIGHFDLIAARYALACVGGIDALALTHLDRLPEVTQVCDAYQFEGDAAELDEFFEHDGQTISAIKLHQPPNLDHQIRLAQLLFRCAPHYQAVPPADYLARLEQELGVTIAITSSGATALDKQIRAEFGR